MRFILRIFFILMAWFINMSDTHSMRLSSDCLEVKDFKHSSRCLDLNMVEKFMHLPRLMKMEVSDQDGLTLINTRIPSDMFNIVCMTKRKVDVSSVFEKFLSHKLPFAWWVGFDEDHAECKQDIEKTGAKCDKTENGMAAIIGELSRDRRCADLEILQVSNRSVLRDFIGVYQELIPHDADSIGRFYSQAADYIIDPESSLKLFVGYYKGRPVATSALFLHAGVAGVWDVTTLPDFRKKGIGTDMTLSALFCAYDNYKYLIGVLTASADGEPVYRKIGFSKIKDYYIFNIPCP